MKSYNVILDNNNEVQACKAFCEKHGIKVDNISGYYEKVYFSIQVDQVKAIIFSQFLKTL